MSTNYVEVDVKALTCCVKVYVKVLSYLLLRTTLDQPTGSLVICA